MNHTNKLMAAAYSLAKSKLEKETGKKLTKRAEILEAVELATGRKADGDAYNLLITYGRVVHNDDRVKKDKAYTLDIAMQQAKRKAEYQPKMISMNSNIKFWSNDNG